MTIFLTWIPHCNSAWHRPPAIHAFNAQFLVFLSYINCHWSRFRQSVSPTFFYLLHSSLISNHGTSLQPLVSQWTRWYQLPWARRTSNLHAGDSAPRKFGAILPACWSSACWVCHNAASLVRVSVLLTPLHYSVSQIFGEGGSHWSWREGQDLIRFAKFGKICHDIWPGQTVWKNTSVQSYMQSAVHSHCFSNGFWWTFIRPCHFWQIQQTVQWTSTGVCWNPLEMTKFHC